MEKFESFLKEMQESYRQMAGMDAKDASDIGIRFKILAEQLAMLSEELEEAKKQSFVQTATGEYLEMHALQRGITRKAATFAKGTAVFERNTAAADDIEIPKGVYIASSGGDGETVRFTTIEAVVLKRGQTSVEAAVQCLTAGKKGNLAAGRLNVMVTPVQGITAVSNSEPIDTGEDAESDEALRSRLLDSYRMVTNGTNSAFYYNRAASYSGVSSVKVLPRMNGVGTVGIVVHGPGVDEELLKLMAEEIGSVKEINVDVTVEQAKEKPLGLSVGISAEEGYSYDDVKEKCTARLTEYMRGMDIGQPLYIAVIVRELLGCEGVANCTVTLPQADSYPLEKEIFVLSGVTVSRMER